MEPKPHPMDDCFFCEHQRFQHKGVIPNENECLMKDCCCIGYTWTAKE